VESLETPITYFIYEAFLKVAVCENCGKPSLRGPLCPPFKNSVLCYQHFFRIFLKPSPQDAAEESGADMEWITTHGNRHFRENRKRRPKSGLRS
jgi:hypothetical protein